MPGRSIGGSPIPDPSSSSLSTPNPFIPGPPILRPSIHGPTYPGLATVVF